MCAGCSTPLPRFRVFYDKSAFFSRKDVRRISIRSPASSARGAARATMTLTCSNIQRKIRALRLIPSNIHAISHQVCSNCGTVHKKSLEERWHSCECGCELDRDTNAVINILRLGRSQRGATCVEAPRL